MGFTLRAVLAELNAGSTVTVVELVPAVVEWARGPMADLFGDYLEDPRVVIREGDVGAIIRRSRSAFDAILLDVDNGPDGLTQAANDRLYDVEGLGHAYRALRPRGAGGLVFSPRRGLLPPAAASRLQRRRRPGAWRGRARLPRRDLGRCAELRH